MWNHILNSLAQVRRSDKEVLNSAAISAILNDAAFCQEEDEDEAEEDYYDSEGESELDRLALIQEAGILT